MIVNSVKQQILNAASVADFETFCDLFTKISECNVQLSEIYLSKSGDTLTHLAARSGCIEILKFLHEHGYTALLEQRNFDGKTPLHVSVQAGHLDCVVFLLSCNVTVDALKRADWTPLMLACTKDNKEIIKTLLSFGANPWCKNKDGWTAFHIAAREGYISVIDCLLENDPHLWKTKSKNRRTPLHTAALHGHLETVQKILSYEDCDKDIQDSCGTTPLMDAVSGNHRHLVEYLIQVKKADFSKTDLLGRNVLHLAAQCCSVECIEYLIVDCLMDINQKTKDGLTPLHFAMKENMSECVNVLMKLGADPLLTDNRGRSADDYQSRKLI